MSAKCIIPNSGGCDVRAWCEGPHCSAVEFLEQLAEEGNADAFYLQRRLERIAAVGMLGNPHHVAHISPRISSVLTPGDARLLFFHIADATVIVCTHGYRELSVDLADERTRARQRQREVERAESICHRYYERARSLRPPKSTLPDEPAVSLLVPPFPARSLSSQSISRAHDKPVGNSPTSGLNESGLNERKLKLCV